MGISYGSRLYAVLLAKCLECIVSQLQAAVVCTLCSVHIRTEEKITLTAGREGGLQNLEVHGLVTLKITNEKYGRIKVAIRNNDTKGAQLQVRTADMIVSRC